ncbi:MAG: carbohydrate ABC transporter permease [Lachnospiraceae bacterium]|nr:carbohydrate ABC transporter permease [Lachnospiraceae bacterium]
MVKENKRRINAVSVPTEILIHIAMILFCALCIVPFILVIIISFTSGESITEKGYSFFPNSWSLESYKYAFEMGYVLWRSYFNSFFITAVGTVASVLVCALYSYSLSRKDFKYRNFFTFFSFFTMLFGGGLVPTFVVTKQVLGLHDSYAAVIIPLLVNPFNFIVMRTFFQTSVPDELIEAAAIDGSGEYNTLFKIVFPVAKPGIATIALLNAIAYWNEWFIPMLYLRNDVKHMPLQHLLVSMQRDVEFLAKNAAMMGAEASKAMQGTSTQALRMVLVVLAVVPIACAYPFFQRYIVAGLTIGSVKG